MDSIGAYPWSVGIEGVFLPIYLLKLAGASVRGVHGASDKWRTEEPPMQFLPHSDRSNNIHYAPVMAIAAALSQISDEEFLHSQFTQLHG